LKNVLWIDGEVPHAAIRLSDASYEAIAIKAPSGGVNIEQLLEECSTAARVPVVVCDENATVADAVRYMRLGAHDVAGKDHDVEAVVESAAEFFRERRETSSDEPWRRHLVGSSRAITRMIDTIRLVGGRRSTVLITGETGTGKEMIARAIHLASPRSQQAMVAVNCNALPENLLEAELFGHVKGAFTGAIHHRIGRFEQAHRGTLFLDEIGDLPLDIQTKLLRVLQEREFQRIGSSETIRVDVRVITATNVDLAQRVQERKFREDLYYRLNVVPIASPALRERLEDISALAHHFVEKICRHEGISLRQLSPESIARLKNYHWPGNVRQLENVVEMAVALSGDRQVLYPSDFALPSNALRRPAMSASNNESIPVPPSGLDFEQTVGQIERQILEDALKKTNGNKTAAAGMLGLKRTTLAAKLKSLEAVAG
jgi:DNA-binding NtrC family response regulator